MKDTLNKLKELKMTKMAEALNSQLADPNSDLKGFEERIKDIVDLEYSTRRKRKFERFLKKADLKLPDATFDEVLYRPERRLDTRTIESLATLGFMEEKRNVLITGSTGAGKTHIGNALCVSALWKFKSVRYIKASNVIHTLEKAEIDKNFTAVLDYFANIDLLCIDDFGLMDLDVDKCRYLFEVLDARDKRRSTIIISQFPVASWYDFFKDNTYADACMDRMVQKSYRIEMNGENMRPKF